MRRIMVVDDERPIVEGLRLIIKKDLGADFEVVATASTGREALVRLDDAKPEIILIDVMMPGLSGLETIKEIRKRSSTIVFILITAYERFDIAREAVSLNVLDYLLKPLQREQVVRAIRRAADQVEAALSLSQRQIEIQEQEFDSRYFLRKALAYGIMDGEDMEDSLGKLCRSLELSTEWMIAGMVEFPPSSVRENYKDLVQVLRYKTLVIPGPLLGHRCLFIIPLTDPSQSTQEITKLQEILTPIASRFRFGSPRKWGDAHLSWCEAQVEPGAPPQESFQASVYFQMEEGLQDQALGGDIKPLKEQLFLDGTLWKMQDSIPTWARSRWIFLLGILYRRMVRQGLMTPETVYTLLDFRDLEAPGSPSNWLSLVNSRLDYIEAHFSNPIKYSPLVSQTLDIIREQFSTTLSLEVLADRLGISPGRLSRLFIAETGQGFLEYLIEVRIDQARKLLSQPGASVKQVSQSCGYQDQNYFSRLFKKMTGMTPSEYSSSTHGGSHD